jgi:hypothetical protein
MGPNNDPSVLKLNLEDSCKADYFCSEMKKYLQ